MKQIIYTSGLLLVMLAVLMIANIFACNRKTEPLNERPEVERNRVVNETELMNDEDCHARIDLIRDYMDSFLCDNIENAMLEPYKTIVQREFQIVDVHSVMGGGIYFRIVFPHHPNDVFQVFTSIEVEEETDSVTAYHIGEFRKIDNRTDKKNKIK